MKITQIENISTEHTLINTRIKTHFIFYTHASIIYDSRTPRTYATFM